MIYKIECNSILSAANGHAHYPEQTIQLGSALLCFDLPYAEVKDLQWLVFGEFVELTDDDQRLVYSRCD